MIQDPVESTALQTKVFSTGLFLAVLSFLVPLAIPSPQIIVGSIVNALLFVSAIKVRSSKWLAAVVILPSVAAFSRGLIFGPFTVFLFYFLPFIWAGNWVLIAVFKKIYEKSFFAGVALSSLAKVSLLFLAANFYVSQKAAPAIFLKSMGFLQLETALLGGLLAFIVTRLPKKSNG